MTRNPYLEMADDEETYGPIRRNAIVDQLAPDPQARPRTPTRTPEQTREMLSGPGGRTTYAPDTADVGGNAYTGPAETQTDIANALPVMDTPAAGAGGAEPPNRQRGYDLLDAYDDPYQRRGGYGGLEPTRRNISMGLLTSGEPYSMVSGAFGMLDAYMRRRALTAPTDFNLADAREIISQAHKDALGRDIDPAYLDSIIRGQGWEQGDRYIGQDQLAYVLDQFAQHGAAEQTARGPETAAATPAATPAGAAAGGTGGGLPFSGFDFSRTQDPSTSAKDAFAAAAQQAPPMTDTSKAGAEAWFREHIAPKMEAAGYRVYDLQGDKAWIGSREDPEGRVPVDWLINAGGSNPQIGWQPESGGGSFGASGAGDLQGAFQALQGMVGPNASREEMEAAITAAFGNVPGFERAYKESALINGQWYDLVGGYGGANPTWQLMPKTDGGASSGVTNSVTNSGINLSPGVSLAPALGNSNVLQEILAEIQRLQRGDAPRAAILDQLGAGA